MSTLSEGLALLATQLAEHASSAVEYRRGGVTLSIDAIREQARTDGMTEINARVSGIVSQWSIKATDLGALYPPVRGDVIVWTEGETAILGELTPDGAGSMWQRVDDTWLRVLVREATRGTVPEGGEDDPDPVARLGDFFADGRVPATGSFDMDGNKIEDLGDPVADSDAATKGYVDAALSTLPGTGDVMWPATPPTTGNLAAFGAPNALADSGIDPTTLATKGYADGVAGAAQTAAEATAAADATAKALNAQRYHGNGVEDASKFAITYDNSARTFTVTSTGAAVWINGVRHEITTQTTTPHADELGTWFLYVNASGALVVSKTAWGLLNDAPLDYAIRGATGGAIPYYELHPSELIDGAWTPGEHLEHHLNHGAEVRPGGFTLSGITLDTNTKAARQHVIDSGTICDESIQLLLPQLSAGGNYYHWWRTSAGAEWDWDYSDDPLKLNGAAPQYDNGSGPADVPTNRYFNMWIFGTTPQTLDSRAYMHILGQAVYTTQAAAQAETILSNIAWASSNPAERAPLWRITYHYTASGAIHVKSYSKLIGQSVTVSGSLAATAHVNTSGRSDPDQHPIEAITIAADVDLPLLVAAPTAPAAGFSGLYAMNVGTPAAGALLHMDGDNDGTTFTDVLGHTFTAVSGAVTKTAIKKFGTSSLYLPGTDDAITADTDDAWKPGTGDWTLDLQLYLPAWTGAQMFFFQLGKDGAGYRSLAMSIGTGGLLVLYAGTDGSWNIFNASTGDLGTNASLLQVGMWNRVTILRNGYEVLGFMNRQLCSRWRFGTAPTANPIFDSDTGGAGRQTCTIGARRTSADAYADGFTGYIDEVRWTKGVALFPETYDVSGAWPTVAPYMIDAAGIVRRIA